MDLTISQLYLLQHHDPNRSVPHHPGSLLLNPHSHFPDRGHPNLVEAEYDFGQFRTDSSELGDYTDVNWSDCAPIDISMVSQKTTLFQFVVNGLGISIVASLGVFGNILSAIVLSRPQMKSSVTCLLLGLAFCDTLLISINILVFSMPYLHGYIDNNFLWKYLYIYFVLLVPYLYPISTTAQTGSVYLTLAVTIERYVAVCHSLKARSICTWRRARICVGVVCCLSIFYNLPRWWEVVAIPLCQSVNNLTLYVNDKSVLRDDPTYVTVYINWTYLVVMYLIPFAGLIVFNLAIYRQVCKANRGRQQFSKHQRRETGIATMLLGVVVVFLLCHVLPLMNHILESFYDTSVDNLVAISNFLVVVNSSVKFVIYCTCGERFRQMFFRLEKDFMECRFWERRNTYRGGETEEMSLASISTCTANNTVPVNLLPEYKIGNQSSIYGTGQ